MRIRGEALGVLFDSPLPSTTCFLWTSRLRNLRAEKIYKRDMGRCRISILMSHGCPAGLPPVPIAVPPASSGIRGERCRRHV
eukprot:1364427-Amorphochlora_amoeboformis.AAC.1